jgi:hypothetical protein
LPQVVVALEPLEAALGAVEVLLVGGDAVGYEVGLDRADSMGSAWRGGYSPPLGTEPSVPWAPSSRHSVYAVEAVNETRVLLGYPVEHPLADIRARREPGGR